VYIGDVRAAYREFAPAPHLAHHVACTWTRVVGAATTDLVIPDACADVVVIDGEALVAGPADRPLRVPLAAGTVIHGIRFRPGAARDILRTDMAELRNAHVELAALTRVFATDPRDPRASLERWAGAQLRARDDGAAIHVARLLVKCASVDDAAAALGFGARRLHRHVTAHCGYGPKTLQRILRVQRAIRLAYAGARGVGVGAGLASLAASAGYADQAHMTREFAALTGLPPARYFAIADPGVGRWMVSDLFKTSAPPGAMLLA
jgi:AraC-like DNA-binding protein